jgi:hypothetical protein
VIAVGAVEAGESGVKVAAVEEGGDGGGSVWVKGRPFRHVIVEHLPDWRGAGLTGAVAGADHLGRGSRCPPRRDGQGSALPESLYEFLVRCANRARSQTHRFMHKSKI